jgi:hypothetical protein
MFGELLKNHSIDYVDRAARSKAQNEKRREWKVESEEMRVKR